MSGISLSITTDDEALQTALNWVVHLLEDPRPMMAEIGELLAESTKARFETSTDPDGRPWAKNTDVTIAQYLSHYKGVYKADGSLSKKGVVRSGSKKPLVGETRTLGSSIRFQLFGHDGVVVGTNKVQAATMQFGAKQGEFGRTRRGAPTPWGDIPARPFLGVSASDRTGIAEILSRHLDAASR